MPRHSRVFKFAKSAKSAKATTQRMMANSRTSMGQDYPSDEYEIHSVKRAKSKDYKALEKTAKEKVYAVTLKKKKRKK